MNVVNFKKYKQRHDEQVAMAMHQQLKDKKCIVEKMQKAIEAGDLRLPK